MEVLERVDNEKGKLRAKLESAVERAKEVCERVEKKTITAAKATDKTVRAHPYEAIGIAFGMGLLVGLLVMRRRRD